MQQELNVYNPAWNRILLRITPLCFITGMVAAFLGQYDTALGEAAVFVSSVLHWRNPRPLSRRFDIIIVSISLATHLLAMWTVGIIASLAFIFIVISMSFFFWSLNFGSYKHHAMGWIFACISNLLLIYARIN